jgi:hypothetical protein
MPPIGRTTRTPGLQALRLGDFGDDRAADWTARSRLSRGRRPVTGPFVGPIVESTCRLAEPPCGAAIPGDPSPQVWSAEQVNSIIASLAAILGVVLGSVLTYLFQARNARQAQEFARDQRLWQERLTAGSPPTASSLALSPISDAAKTTAGTESKKIRRVRRSFLPATSPISYGPKPRPLCAESSSSAVSEPAHRTRPLMPRVVR